MLVKDFSKAARYKVCQLLIITAKLLNKLKDSRANPILLNISKEFLDSINSKTTSRFN